MTNLVSIEGQLYEATSVEARDLPRSPGYKPIQIGQAIMVQYLRIRLSGVYSRTKDKKNRLLITSYTKVEEKKKAAAQVVNHFDDRAVISKNDSLVVSFDSAKKYSHSLLYYSPSYTGHSLKITTEIWEIDGSKDNKWLAVLKGSISNAAGIPLFLGALPWLAIAKGAVKFFETVASLFAEPDFLVEEDLGVYFGMPHKPILQSGRYVCLPKVDDNKAAEICSTCSLTPQNLLVNTASGEEYPHDYLVVQVNSHDRPELADFEYEQGSAELLKMINEKSAGDIASKVTELFKDASDIRTVREIRKLVSADSGSQDKEKISALYKLLSSEIKAIYKNPLEP